MSLPTGSVHRRDAAVTAVLTGAVVIVLGYASGIGLRPESAPAATAQPAPVVQTPVAEPPPTPAAVPAPAAVVPVAPAPVVVPQPVVMPTTPAPSHAAHTAAPSPTPTPTPTGPTCSPGLLDGVTSLLGGTTGNLSLPLVGDLGVLLDGLLGAGSCSTPTPAAAKR